MNLLISGVPAIKKGAGLFLLQLEKEVLDKSEVKIIYVNYRMEVGVFFKNSQFIKATISLIKHIFSRVKIYFLTYSGFIKNPKSVILIHHQLIGMKLCDRIIEKRNGNTTLFLLDSGFFCLRSYNHIDGTNEECLACLGGDYSNIKQNDCISFPVRDKYSKQFLQNLHGYVHEKIIKFIAQNLNQENLIRSHFGDDTEVKTLGIWTADLPEKQDVSSLRRNIITSNFVLFHGAPLSAKGVFYTLDLAKICPEIEFVFPFQKSRLGAYPTSSNCTFKNMTWDTGLMDCAKKARIVLAPSLNSSPIESALVKSLMYCNAVGVVDIETSFSAEIDDRIIIKLSKDPVCAARKLEDFIHSNLVPDQLILNQWIDHHFESNYRPLCRYLEYNK